MPRKKKSKSRQYFTKEVENAIIEYNLLPETEYVKRNKIYNSLIYPAFDKMAENLIHKFKFYYYGQGVTYEDCKHNVVAFLTEKIHKYTEGKGKAFSYFSIVGKNYLILNNNKNYKKLKTKEDLMQIDEERDLPNELARKNYTESLSDYIDLWVEDIDNNLEVMFPNLNDRKIADSVLELFRVRKGLETFHKKMLYVLIRERTGLKTQKITKIVNTLKDHFYENLTDYLKEK